MEERMKERMTERMKERMNEKKIDRKKERKWRMQGEIGRKRMSINSADSMQARI